MAGGRGGAGFPAARFCMSPDFIDARVKPASLQARHRHTAALGELQQCWETS